MRVARVGVYLGGEVVVTFGRSPIALLVLVDEFGFAVTGEITEVDQGLVAGLEDIVSERSGYARARGRLGSCGRVSTGVVGTVGTEGSRTIILPLLGNLAQLGNAVEVGIQV